MVTASNPGRYERFDQLAEEFAARYRRGERPGLQEYVDRCPDLADEIREMFPALVAVERAEEVFHDLAAPHLRQVGDYRVVREVGRGGMGVVYEAEQVSLGRRVALKVLPHLASGEPRALERSRREARAAARLHHTNIVPVFDVGQGGAVCYDAMQFIDGQGLDKIVGELRRHRDRPAEGGVGSSVVEDAAPKPMPDAPRTREVSDVALSLLTGRFMTVDLRRSTSGPDPDVSPESTERSGPGRGAGEALEADRPGASGATASAVLPGGEPLSVVESGRRAYFRGVARIGQQAAAGLAYAHALGVVHRDIKPSNLLLDGSGVVWITDFGLAKDGDDGLTRTGDVLGTLRYMAPERLRGKGDARSDVYALGLTLYELLALRPAFDPGDRLELVERIKAQEPRRPRALDPGIPRDLETIVLKAIEKDQGARYQGVEELGEDLRRFLADETILARRANRAERSVRSCRRNPGLAAALALVATLMTALTAGSLVASFWLNRERVRAEQAERETELRLVDSLTTAAPDSVPYILGRLRGARDLAVPILEYRFGDESTAAEARLRASVALVSLGASPPDYLIEQIGTAPESEGRNLCLALATAGKSCAGPLRERFRGERSPEARARIASALLALGDADAAKAMLAFDEDPTDRTVFIHGFSGWHGDLAPLAALLRREGDPALRSGLVAALGSILPGRLSEGERLALEPLFRDLFRESPDGATHSAAGWALRRWGLAEPEIAQAEGPAPGRRWFVNTRGITMIEVPPGPVLSAEDTSKRPYFQSVVTRPFCLGDREVTIAQFRAFLDDPEWPASEKPAGWSERLPPMDLSPWKDGPAMALGWSDAVRFCNWLSAKTGRTPCCAKVGEGWAWRREADGYRLPTDVEWEHALRSGSGTWVAIGDRPERLGDYATLLGRAAARGAGHLPVGPGFFDMIGNASEWCRESEPGAPGLDPVGSTEGDSRIVRGGSFSSGTFDILSTARARVPISSLDRVGFRVACSAPGASPRPEETLAVAARSLPDRPEPRRAAAACWAQLAQAHRARGRLAEAIAASREAIRLDLECPLARHNLGTALRKQSEPDVLESWDLDAGPEGWEAIQQVRLTSKKGFVRAESTGEDPFLIAPLAAPAGWKSLTVRARAPRPALIQVYSSTTAPKPPGINPKEYLYSEERSERCKLPASGEEWEEFELFFRPEEPLTSLRIDTGGVGSVVDIDAIVLRSVTAPDALRRATEALARRPDDRLLRRRRGDLLADMRRWGESGDDYAAAMEGLYSECTLFGRLAVARLLAGDEHVYHVACAEALARCGAKIDPETAVRVVSACVAAPDAVSDMTLLAEVAERTVPVFPCGVRIVGAVRYRAGLYREALQQLEAPRLVGAPRAWDMLFQAMAHAKLGESARARRLLNGAGAWMDEADRTMRLGEEDEGHPRWGGTLEVALTRLLRQEAEEVVRGAR